MIKMIFQRFSEEQENYHNNPRRRIIYVRVGLRAFDTLINVGSRSDATGGVERL